jgi:nitric oxide reductase subunit B
LIAVVIAAPRESPKRSESLVSNGWFQGVALVMIFGFLVMGLLAFRTYTDSMPQPEKAVDPQGEVVFTAEEITSGQQIFLRRGLQQYGSIVGHGGYLGPDYTADYLRRSATSCAIPASRTRGVNSST